MALVVSSGISLLLRALGVAPPAAPAAEKSTDLVGGFAVAVEYVGASQAKVVLFYSAAFLYAKAICDLDKASPEAKELLLVCDDKNFLS